MISQITDNESLSLSSNEQKTLKDYALGVLRGIDHLTVLVGLFRLYGLISDIRIARLLGGGQAALIGKAIFNTGRWLNEPADRRGRYKGFYDPSDHRSWGKSFI